MTNNNQPKPKPIETKNELIQALKDVAKLEQQFMCMYLYAAFSLKKNPDPTCNEAQLEAVRRWASKIYMIARQEMEHLSLVNSMLAAIGAPPHFSRQNIPAQSPHLEAKQMRKRYYGEENTKDPEPCDFPFIFEPFDLCSAKRYACMESPALSYLSNAQKEEIKTWCFQNSHGNCPCLPQSGNTQIPQQNPPTHHSYQLGDGKAPSDGVEVGTIAQLYHRLRQGFITVAQGEEGKSLFVGPGDQHQVEIPNEYDIYLFPVTDLDSALSAIEVVIQQGEGLDAPPDFETHFLNFYEIAQEYEKLQNADQEKHKNFQPFLPVPRNPKLPIHITNKFTKEVSDLFDYSYVTLLYVLTGLYGWYKPRAAETSYPHLSTALAEITFGPAMTMLIRSLGEVLVKLPLDQNPDQVAAPTFFIDKDDEKKLLIDASCNDWQSNSQYSQYSFYTDIRFYLERFEHILHILECLNNIIKVVQMLDCTKKRRKVLDELKNCGSTEEIEEMLKDIKVSDNDDVQSDCTKELNEVLAELKECRGIRGPGKMLEVIKDFYKIKNYVPDEDKTRLTFIYQNVYRMTGNLRQIYQTGFFSKFEGVT